MNRIRLYLLLIVCSVLATAAQAGIRPVMRQSMTGTPLVVGAVLKNSGTDIPLNANPWTPKTMNWDSVYTFYQVSNTVRLEVVDQNQAVCLPDSFNFWMDVKIRRLSRSYVKDSVYTRLQVNYNSRTGITYGAVDAYNFTGACYLEVEVMGMSNTAYNNYVVLSCDMLVERYKTISNATQPGLNTVKTYDAANNTLTVNWTNLDGAGVEEYDIEWTFIDDIAADGVSYLPTSGLWFNFDRNSTRVTVKAPGTSLTIPLNYEHGYLVFRTRGVSYMGANHTQPYYTRWTNYPYTSRLLSTYIAGSGANSYYFIDNTKAHEQNMNWQYSATFAEEAKRKEVITYFDGSLRNRQMVTLSNSDNTAIVGETIYDNEGRAAINVLPVPTGLKNLKYYGNFNRNLSNEPYSREDFDLNNGACGTSTAPMAITEGASEYYSVNNTFQAVADNYKYIADANGYPFTRTEYMPDNTNRVKRQSGVGDDHQLDGGHETRYYYGRPAQEELDRLFGNSIGYAEHYQKNMVIDANGQISVSYLDLKGRNVATSLAGSVPGNVEQLPNYQASQELKINLLNSTDTLYTDSVIKLNTTIMVTSAGPYVFDYGFNASSFASSCLKPNICLDCVYDLTISLQDACGQEMFDGDAITAGTQPFTRVIGQPSADPDTTCGTPVAYKFKDDTRLNDTVIVNLTPGVYMLTKTLAINQEAIDLYTDVHIRQNTCLKTLGDFETQFLSKVDYSQCGETCEECVARLGTKTDFVNKQLVILSYDSVPVTQPQIDHLNNLYDSLVIACNSKCQPLNPCTVLYETLKMDMRPGGQYALYPEGYSNDWTGITNSIMDSSETDFGANYRYSNTTTWTRRIYLDANGLPDSIVLDIGRKVPAADAPYQQFAANFKESWLDQLVQLHPEYCHYTNCQANSAGNTYEQDMLNTDTYSQALTKGYLNPLGQGTVPYTINSKDPYFLSGPGTADLTAMQNALANVSNGYSAWQIPVIVYHCNNSTDPSYISSCLASSNMSSPSCAPYKDLMWKQFRAMYLAAKQQLMETRFDGCDDAKASLMSGKTRRHYGISDAKALSGGTLGTASADKANADHKTQCQSLCESYADVWMQQLSACDYNGVSVTLNGVTWNTPIDIQRILRDSLIRVCVYGCDMKSPLGASEVAPAYKTSSEVYFKTFQGVVQGIMGTHFVPGQCDANLISFPSGYAHDYLATTNPLADTCACSHIPAPQTDTACVCEEPNNDLKTAILTSIGMPEDYKCKTCISCEQLFTALNKIDVEYGSLVSDATFKDRKILETLFNKYLNFNLTYEEYQSFMAGCLSDSSVNDSTLSLYRQLFTLAMTGGGESMTLMSMESGGSVMENLYSGEGESMQMMSGEGEMTAMSAPPANHHYLDACGCNNLQKAWELWSANPAGRTFQEYVNMYTPNPFTSDAKTLLDRCKEFYSTDEDALPTEFTSTAPWNSIQKANMEQYVQEDELYLPDGFTLDVPCDINKPNNPPVVREGAPGPYDPPLPNTDCSIIIAQHDAFNNEIAAHPTDPAYTQYTPLYNEAYLQELARRVILASGGIPEGDVNSASILYSLAKCLPGIPDPTCPACYELDENKALLVKGFLNQLTTARIKTTTDPGPPPVTTTLNMGNYLNTSGWFVSPTFPLYFNTIMYAGGTSAATLKSKITLINGQSLKFYIKDANNKQTNWELAFTGYHPKYNFGRIVSIDSITPVKEFSCMSGKYFRIVATIQVPAQYCTTMDCRETVEMIGYQDAVDLRTACGTQKRLCNKPLMRQVEYIDPCHADLENRALHNAQVAYQQYLDSVKVDFKAAYTRQCMRSARSSEYFTMRYKVHEYHFTLYYYDQAANLVQTIPPAGVSVITNTATLATVRSARVSGTGSVFPSHILPTQYLYNTLNQLVWQTTPDAGISEYWYDRVGRLVVSRNARQNAALPNKQYSYTQFDALNRITEVGQVSQATAMTQATAFDPALLASWMTTALATREQITHTFYDVVAFAGVQSQFADNQQQYLRGRVVSTTYSDNGTVSPYTNAVHYSYDVHGNVSTLVREVPTLSGLSQSFKRTDYQYDLVSGKVNQVWYQHGKPDRFYHRYTYDADNRITNVETSRDKMHWERDATYQYYLHGPLMRTELGQLKVQGIDYAYTIQGWLKGVNSGSLKRERDMGQDGMPSGVHSLVAPDVFGYVLGYYEGDYQPVGGVSSANRFDASTSGSVVGSAALNLYNGNIRMMTTAISKFMEGGTWQNIPLATAYRYDQLNRLKVAEYYNNFDSVNNAWKSTGSKMSEYYNQFTYDANGNILTQERRGAGNDIPMDVLTYNYFSGTNRLEHVDDSVLNTANYSDDIDDQASGNYTYDQIGNLTGDVAEEIQTIDWTVYGKVQRITRTSGSTKADIEFNYTPDGHRAMKKMIPKTGATEYTYYSRDAQGNELATYLVRNDSVWLEEVSVYGSSRLGTQRIHQFLNNQVVADTHFIAVTRGQKRYELSNHLGNVLAVVNDKHKNTCTTTVKYFAEVMQAYDYSPFGAILPGRIYGLESQRVKRPGKVSQAIFNFNDATTQGFGGNSASVKNIGNRLYVYTGISSNRGCVRTLTGLFADTTYTITFTVSDSIPGFNTYKAYVVQSGGGTIATATYTGPGTYSLTFVMPNTGILAVQFYLNAENLSPAPTINFYVDDVLLTFNGSVFVQETVDQYRFGFNDKEKDNEVKGTGNSYNYGFRIHDPRLGRFLSVDPLTREYPWWTPYQFAGNMPIKAVDMDGLEIWIPLARPMVMPRLVLPRVVVPLPPGEVVIPPISPSVPKDLTIGQPQSNSEKFDWSKVDRKDPSTWPEPPFAGEPKIGEPSRNKPAERGEKSWYDPEGGEWRPHTPDKYHPEGHWDYKPAGKNSEWQDIFPKTVNLPELEVKSKQAPEDRNFLQKVGDFIREIGEKLERNQQMEEWENLPDSQKG